MNKYNPLTIANLRLNIDINIAQILKNNHLGYKKFFSVYTAEALQASAVINEIDLSILPNGFSNNFSNKTPLCVNEIWELWRNKQGSFLFVGLPKNSPRWIIIDPNFTQGHFWGDLLEIIENNSYPLQGIDLPLFANWLAIHGDLILHAAGFKHFDKGYACIGVPGAGKSTLASAIAKEPDVTILGEDQVILRYLEGKFWIFGTPWHVNPDMCSPLGVPLERIFFLDRQHHQTISSMNPIEGVISILQTAFIPYYRQDKMPTILDRLMLLSENVPFYNLAYRLGSDILKTILSV